MKNQILQQKFKNDKKDKFSIEFGDEIAEIPYGETIVFTGINKLKSNEKVKNNELKNFVMKNKYKLQFILSVCIASTFLFILFFNIYQNNKKEKMSQDLLNSYQLTTLYSNNTLDKILKSDTISTPFVIGMIKIDKINLNYPILSETTEELLKISVCRFAGPMPNRIRKFVHCWS